MHVAAAVVGRVPHEFERTMGVAMEVVGEGGMARAVTELAMMMATVRPGLVAAAVRDRDAQDPPRSQSDQDLHHQQEDGDRLGERGWHEGAAGGAGVYPSERKPACWRWAADAR